jgi:hypothetical protein
MSRWSRPTEVSSHWLWDFLVESHLAQYYYALYAQNSRVYLQSVMSVCLPACFISETTQRISITFGTGIYNKHYKFTYVSSYQFNIIPVLHEAEIQLIRFSQENIYRKDICSLFVIKYRSHDDIQLLFECFEMVNIYRSAVQNNLRLYAMCNLQHD